MNVKLTVKDVRLIRRSPLPDNALAKQFGVARLAIFRARTGQTFQNVKTPPSYRLKKVLNKP